MAAIGTELAVGVPSDGAGAATGLTAPTVEGPRFADVIEDLRQTQRAEASQLSEVLDGIARGETLTAADAWTVQVLVSGQALRVELAARLVDAVSQGSRQLLQQGG